MLMSPVNLTKGYDYEYDYEFVFGFERSFYDTEFRRVRTDWMEEYWYISLIYAACYVTLVHVGQHMMRKREKFHLYRSLVAWNVLLAGFSILGTVRFLPNFVQTVYSQGLVHSVCVLDYNHGVSACWSWIYSLSKFVELIDTAFIILRKQNLIFLHWYHHAITMIYTWYSFRDLVAYGRWFIAMNYTIHAVMYTYYTFRAMRFNIPKRVSITITSLQLLQMVVGIFVNVVAAIVIYDGRQCRVTLENIYFSFLLYLSFFVLFFIYFRNVYMKTASHLTTKKTMTVTIVTTTMSKTNLSPKSERKASFMNKNGQKKLLKVVVESDYEDLKTNKKIK